MSKAARARFPKRETLGLSIKRLRVLDSPNRELQAPEFSAKYSGLLIRATGSTLLHRITIKSARCIVVFDLLRRDT